MTQHRYDEIIFSPDVVYDPETVCKRLRELAFLNKEATINFILSQKGTRTEQTFHYEGGIAAYASHITQGTRALHDPISLSRISGTTEV